jgi:hypothetical protein
MRHNRILQAASRLEEMAGSIEQRETADRTVDGMTHVLYMARRSLELPTRPDDPRLIWYPG